MPYIVVDEAQARVISEATESIEIRDRQGKNLGYVVPGFSDEDLAIARQRRASREPRYLTAEVLEHLRLLDGA